MLVEFDMHRRILAIAVAAVGLSLSQIASTADWPIKPVRIISPTSPGGVSDTFARMLAERYRERRGSERPGRPAVEERAMRQVMSWMVVAVSVGVAGCGYFQGPRLTISTAPGGTLPEAATVQRPTAKPRAPTK